LQAGLDCRSLRVGQQIGEQRERCAQPAQAHPHLMHALGITLEQRGRVADDLPQTGAADGLEAVACADTGNEINPLGRHRRIPLVVEQLVAALRFAPELEPGRNRLHQLACNVEEIRLAPSLELELDFTQRR
jgi:hypothetical protein